MTDALILLTGIVTAAWGIWLLDWLARRRDRQSKHRRA